MIAAMAMRKLQALHLIATPGVLTTTDVILAIINDLDRALLQAPSMFLERKLPKQIGIRNLKASTEK